MTAKYYEEPPQEIIHLYDEEDGVWTLKPLDSDECLHATDGEITAARAYDHNQRAKSHIYDGGVGDVNSNEKGSGARYNTGKPPMHFIPLEQQMIVWLGHDQIDRHQWCIMEKLALFEKGEVPMCDVVSLLYLEDLEKASYVWAYGADKYAAFNWATGMAWSIPLSCISRHIQAIIRGEKIDKGSQCDHWGHVVCNILMLDHYSRYYTEGDDRPPKEVF